MSLDLGAVTLEVESSPPQKSSSPVTILVHPHPKMGGDMTNKVIDQVFRRSVERGWGALRYNSRGVGASTGEYDEGSGETEDLLGLFDWTNRNFKTDPSKISLVGYSFGSWIAARASARLPVLSKLILVAPPIRTMDFSPLGGVRHRKYVYAAGKDEFCPLPELHDWYAKLESPKRIHVVENADHFFVGHTTELIRQILRTLEE